MNRTPMERRFPPIMVGAMITLALIGTGYKSWFDPNGPAVLPETPIEASRALRFEDVSDGRVVVIDAQTDQPIEYLEIGTNGFLRSTLRGLARARAPYGRGAETPFVIERRIDGQILLIDPVTHRFLDLRAFGKINADVFARYLDRDSPSPAVSTEARL
ncbi:MAG: photosynthetic complex assembly protein PuhC [Pseudomonadota bacterium]